MARQAEIESSVLGFDRRQVHDGVQLARIGLRKGEASSFHHHTITRDTFFVMGGALTITLHLSADQSERAAQASEVANRNSTLQATRTTSSASPSSTPSGALGDNAQSAGNGSYRSLSATPPRIERLGDGREVHRVRLLPGEVFVIEPNVVHCASNLDEEPCHFLCIEGIGSYDFVQTIT